MVNMNRILLAEDNDDLRELITDFLSEHGLMCMRLWMGKMPGKPCRQLVISWFCWML